MTEAESMADSRDSYTEACRAERMRLVVKGEVLPREAEPICIVTLAGLRAIRKYRSVYGDGE